MKIRFSPRKTVLWLLILLLSVSLLAACSPPPAAPPPTLPETPDQQETPNKEIANASLGEIKDPVQLEQIWQEYVYDGIASVFNTWEFNSAEEIDPAAVAKFCWDKYQAEHGTAGLQKEREDSFTLLFPLSSALEYAQRYFNLSSLDVSKIPDHTYHPGKQAFLFYPDPGKHPKPRYSETNAWGLTMEKVTRHADNTLVLELVRADGYQGRRLVDSRQTITLIKREDGSMYFAKGSKEFINNRLVTISGEVETFPEIKGFSGNLKELGGIAEADGKLIVAYPAYDQREKPFLALVDLHSMSIVKKWESGEPFTRQDVKFAAGQLLVRLKDKVLILDQQLQVQEEIPLPPALSEKIKWGTEINRPATPDAVFGGYDISSDLSQIVYSDESGLKWLDIKSGREKLLAKTVPVPGSELIQNSYHFSPRFVADDQKVISTMSGYEGTMGYTLCDLTQGTAEALKISYEGSTGSIRYDTGLLEINIFKTDPENQSEGYFTYYLDFQSGKVTEIKLESPGDTGYIRFEHLCLVGEYHGAFITSKWNHQNNIENLHYLNRLDLQSLAVTPEIVSIKAAEPHILAVLTDGRIVFWYEYNPSEKGVCITK